MPAWTLLRWTASRIEISSAASVRVKMPAVPEVARLPQSSEATSDKQDDDQQAGNAEPDVSHGSIPGREDSSTFGNLKSIVREGELVTSNLTFALVVARRV